MTVTRSAARTLSNILSSVRNHLQDRAQDTYGTTKPASALRYQDTEIYEKFNFFVMELSNRMALQHNEEAINYEDMTYTGALVGMDLPTDVGAGEIFSVYDVTNSDIPLTYDYISHREFLDKIKRFVNGAMAISRGYYTLQTSDTSTVGGSIICGPNADGKTIRIYYLTTPWNYSDGADVVLMSARWADLLALGTAVAVQADYGGVDDQLAARYASALDLFTQFATRQKAPDRIRMIKRPF